MMECADGRRDVLLLLLSRPRVGLALTVTLFLLASSGRARAQLPFLGGEWAFSEKPSGLTLDDRGHLVWSEPKPSQQVTVWLVEQALSDVGDVAEVAFVYYAEASSAGYLASNVTHMSGTGDFRIGLFDSNGRGHVKEDGHDYTDPTWVGYLGFHARVFPHIPRGHCRQRIEGEVHLPGNMMKRREKAFDAEAGQALLSSAGTYERLRYIDGFELVPGHGSPLILRLERTAPDTIVFTVTLNEITYSYEDTEPEHQPRKIDALAIYFPNPRPYHRVVFAPLADLKQFKQAEKTR
jgi:hypothetical protein